MHLPFPEPAGGFDEGDDFGPRRGGGVVSSNHMGVDFGRAGGTSIPAAGDGTVVLSQWYSGYGNCTILEHGKNAFGQKLYSLYGHQQALEHSVGDFIGSGERVGPVGTTGNSTGNHLHFGTMIGSIGNFVDPVQFVKDYAHVGESATAGLGTNPLDNSQEETDMPVTIEATAYNGSKHSFTVAKEFISHNATQAQADTTRQVNSATDELHYLSADAFFDYLDGMGIPRAVVDLEGGKVQNPMTGQGEVNGTWSRGREAIQKLDAIKAKLGA